jgi:hypothetical protein
MPSHLVCVGNSALGRVWLIDSLPSGGRKFPARDTLNSAAVTRGRAGSQAAACRAHQLR